MKCQKCNGSFKIIGVNKERIGTCPKCGEKIIPAPNAFESISEAIYYCIQIGSKEPFDILNNKTKLNSYLEDTLGSSYPERNMIKAAIDSDIGATLFKARSGFHGAQKEAFDEAVEQMRRSYGTEIGIAKKTVKYFTDAIGWNIIAEQPQKSKETVQSAASPLNNSAVRPQAQTNNNVQPAQPKDNGQRQQYNNNYPVQQPQKAQGTVHSAASPANNSAVRPHASTNNNVLPAQPQKPAKKKGCLSFFLILTLILFAAIAIIFLKIFLFNDKDKNETSKNNTSVSQNTEISENDSSITTSEVEDSTAEATKESLEKGSKATEKTSSTEKDTTQPITTAKSDETGKYTVRSLSQYIDYESKNHKEMFFYDSFDVDTENNILYYALGDSIYKVDLDTGDSELYTQIEAYEENKYMYLIYNQFNHKMYSFLDGYDYAYEKSYLFDISKNEPELILTTTIKDVYSSRNFISFVSANTLGIVPNPSNSKAYEINLVDQSEKKGYVSYCADIYNTWGDYRFEKRIPIFKNDSYYWLESTEGISAICYTMKSICNDEKNCGDFIGLFENTISQCVTDNEAYIMTDDFSIYRIDVERLLENYDDGNSNPDYSCALELVIYGNDIKQTGINNISEPFGLKMTTDGRFVVFDKFDNTFKIVEKK